LTSCAKPLSTHPKHNSRTTGPSTNRKEHHMSGHNKIALITGAGSGVGRAVALAMAKEGYTVVITGRRASALEETVATGKGLSGSLFAIPADLTDPDQVAKLFAAVKDKYGRLDVLFNNAGVSAPPACCWKISTRKTGRPWSTPICPPCSIAPNRPSRS
jgi:NAD(P)-dependent dehydrogenase (short-subunit alcohol dehydrogenase family)